MTSGTGHVTSADGIRERLSGGRTENRLPMDVPLAICHDAEVTAAGAHALLLVAALDADIAGFPEDVVMTGQGDDGREKRMAGMRREPRGMWRIVCVGNAPCDPLVAEPWNRTMLLHAAGRAMDVPDLGSRGLDVLSGYGRMPADAGSVDPFVERVMRKVPRHALLGPLAFGPSRACPAGIGVEDVMTAWGKALAIRGHDLDGPVRPDLPDPLLHAYIERGDASQAHVRALVRAGCGTETRDGNGRTPLLRAIAAGWFKLAKELLDLGADPHARDADGGTAMDALIDVAGTCPVYHQPIFPGMMGILIGRGVLAGRADPAGRLRATMDAIRKANPDMERDRRDPSEDARADRRTAMVEGHRLAGIARAIDALECSALVLWPGTKSTAAPDGLLEVRTMDDPRYEHAYSGPMHEGGPGFPEGVTLDVCRELEESRHGSCSVIVAAAMEHAIEGFPSEIPMRGAFSERGAKWTGLRKDALGHWRIVSEDGNAERLLLFCQWSSTTLARAAARAMGFPRRPELPADPVLSRLSSKRPSDAHAAVGRVWDTVPAHVLAAPLNSGFVPYDPAFAGANEILGEWARALGERGVDLDAPTSPSFAEPPLLTLITRRWVEPACIRSMVEAGCGTEVRGRDGATALARAVDLGALAYAVALVEAGADVGFAYEGGDTLLDRLLDRCHVLKGVEEAYISTLASMLLQSGVHIRDGASVRDRLEGAIERIRGEAPGLRAYEEGERDEGDGGSAYFRETSRIHCLREAVEDLDLSA